MYLKRFLQELAGKCGYRITKTSGVIGKDPFQDMRIFFLGDRPIVFDVGANIGQTVQAFRKVFRTPQIQSFEPSPSTFEQLKTNTLAYPDTHIWNCGMGASKGQMALQENDSSTMSSLLDLGHFGWGSVVKHSHVDIDTIDDFCHRHGIETIDILKSDTQGYDLEVFKGAERMFEGSQIGLVYTEIILNKMYKDLPSLGQIYDFLINRGFLLVSFYEFAHQENLASWTDALFVHRSRVSTFSLPTAVSLGEDRRPTVES